MLTGRRARRTLTSAVFGAVIGGMIALIAWASGVGYLAATLIVLTAVFLNGLFATLEDDLPGGFNNPEGRDTPRYVAVVGHVVHTVLALACGALAAVFLLAAHHAGWTTPRGMACISFAIGAVFAYVGIKHSKPIGLTGLAIFVGIPILVIWARQH